MLFYEEKSDYLIVNENVAKFRVVMGYKQSDLADLLDMKHSTYSQMERKGNIPAMTLWQISKILDVPMEYFFSKDTIREPIINPIEPDPFRPLNNKEKGAITIIRNLSGPRQKAVYDFITQQYRRKK